MYKEVSCEPQLKEFTVHPTILRQTKDRSWCLAKCHFRFLSLTVKHNCRWYCITSCIATNYHSYLSLVTTGDTGRMLGSFWYNWVGSSGMAVLSMLNNCVGFQADHYQPRFVQKIIVVINDFKTAGHSSSVWQWFCRSQCQVSMSPFERCPPPICYDCSM